MIIKSPIADWGRSGLRRWHERSRRIEVGPVMVSVQLWLRRVGFGAIERWLERARQRDVRRTKGSRNTVAFGMDGDYLGEDKCDWRAKGGQESGFVRVVARVGVVSEPQNWHPRR